VGHYKRQGEEEVLENRQGGGASSSLVAGQGDGIKRTTKERGITEERERERAEVF